MYLGLLFRLLWVLSLCDYAELWPEEQESSRDGDQQCNASLNMGYYRKSSVWRDPFGELTLSSWLLYYPWAQRLLECGEGYLLVQFSCVRSTFCQEQIVAQCHGEVTL